jgi:hypothetical protein
MEDFQSMTKFLFAALAAVVAIGYCATPAMAAPTVHFYQRPGPSVGPDASPNVTPTFAAGVTAFGLPPTTSGAFPCFGPNAPCTDDVAGGLLVGLPVQTVPVTSTGTAGNCTTEPCGQLYQTFQTTTTSGSLSIKVTIKQGTNTLFTFSKAKIGTAAKNSYGIVDLNGAQLAATAVPGTATLSISTKIGTKTVTGTTTLLLQ